LTSAEQIEEKELRRTKRDIYQALLKRQDVDSYVDLKHPPTTTKRPFVTKHSK